MMTLRMNDKRYFFFSCIWNRNSLDLEYKFKLPDYNTNKTNVFRWHLINNHIRPHLTEI